MVELHASWDETKFRFVGASYCKDSPLERPENRNTWTASFTTAEGIVPYQWQTCRASTFPEAVAQACAAIDAKMQGVYNKKASGISLDLSVLDNF